MIGTVDIHRAIVALWDSESIDDDFQLRWTESQKQAYVVLLETEASPSQPFPYCTFETFQPSTIVRMTGKEGAGSLRETRDLALTFNVHAKHSEGISAKSLAASLAERVMECYGGHPTKPPKATSLTHGGVLLCQYQSEGSIRTGDQEHQWVLNYLIRSDVPVRI